MAPTGSEGGNTKTPSKKRDTSKKAWCFTLNNWTEDEYNELITFVKMDPKNKYIIGKEIGEGGTPHLQGYINLHTKKRLSENKLINKRIHWEGARGTELENYKYCSKDNNFITNIRMLKILKKEQLLKWQLDIIDIIEKEPDERKIYWYWEATGKAGKSSFAKYICHHYGGIPVEGKKNDILYCCAINPSDIYIFDFERSMEDYISYSAMEKIKNGFYMSAKYESAPVIRNSPHVICFANFKPDESKLSSDRWNIYEIMDYPMN